MNRFLDWLGDVLARDAAVYVLCVSSMTVLATVGVQVAPWIA